MQRMRRLAPLLLAGSLVLLPKIALGHTELARSDPPDGSTLSAAPDEVVLTFEAEVDEAASFTVLDPDGRQVGSGSLDLEVADRNVLRGDVEVARGGRYTVGWSVTGDDGHDVEGEVTFTYEPEAEEQATAPDTAVPARPGSPLALLGALLGALLVTLAVLIPVRRARAVRG